MERLPALLHSPTSGYALQAITMSLYVVFCILPGQADSPGCENPGENEESYEKYRVEKIPVLLFG